MAIPIQLTFVDGTTVVSASWLNRMQEMGIGVAKFKRLYVTGTNVVMECGTGQDAATINIAGQMRTAEVNKTLSFSSPSDADGTYDIYAAVTGGDVDPAFSLVKTLSPAVPSATYYRKLASVSWASSTLTNLAMEPGIGVGSHGSQHAASGSDPLPAGAISETMLSNDVYAALRTFR